MGDFLDRGLSLVICITMYSISHVYGSSGVYCETEAFVLQCPINQVAMITRAKYGLMRPSKCSKETRSCETDVKIHLDAWCSGRMSCSVPVTNLVIEGIMPCPQEYRSTLEVQYNCTPALPTSSSNCDHPLTLVQQKRPVYLSSALATAKKCGTVDKPLIVSAKPGQQLSITLLDYTITNNRFNADDNNCKVLTIVKDPALRNQPKTMCSGMSRESHVITTLANEAEIRIMTKEDYSFMLRIQVIGCADPAITSSTRLTRAGDSAEISCPGSDDVWKMTCKDGQWIGTMKNCSHVKVNDGTDSEASVMKGVTLSEELSVAIIVLVALLVGVIVLAVGVLCLKRYSHQRSTTTTTIQQEEYWPPPPPSAELTNDMAYKSSDGSGLSNEYYRTWQLQHHHHQNNPNNNNPVQLIDASGGNNPILMANNRQPPPYHTGGERFHNNMNNRSMDHILGPGSTGTKYTGAGDNNLNRLSNGNRVEHIYESPKFDRESVYSAPERTTTGAGILDLDINGPVTTAGGTKQPSNNKILR